MGTLFKSIFLVAKESLMEWKRDYRVWALAILSAVVLVRYLYGLNLYGFEYGTRVTPFLLPILFNDSSVANGLVKILLFLGAICLFSDAPFYSQTSAYQWIRTGRTAWYLGKCAYIWLASFLYALFLAVTAFLAVLPTVSIHDLWGSTLRDWLNNRNNWYLYAGNLEIPFPVIRMIYPWSAELLSLGAVSLSFCMIGHLICLVNLLVHSKAAGISVAAILVMLDPVIHYFAFTETQLWMYRFSPVSWCSMELWDIAGGIKPLSTSAVFPAMLLLIMMLTGGIVLRMRECELQTETAFR